MSQSEKLLSGTTLIYIRLQEEVYKKQNKRGDFTC